MKVLLFADSGGKYYHVGDEAMLYETLKWYKKNYPKARIIILSKSSREFPHLNWPAKRIINRGYFLILAIKTLLWRFLNKNYFNREEFNFVNQIKNHDRIHFTGGGNITSLFTPWLYYSFFVIFVSWLLRKQAILTSQTIGPIWGIDRVFALFILNLPLLIVLREDTKGKNPLWHYGIIFPEIKGMLDVAYLLPYKTYYQLLPKTNKFKLGLSLHYWQGFNHFKMVSILKRLIKKISQSYPIEVVLIPHVIAKKDYPWRDVNLMKLVVKNLPKKIKVVSLTYKQLIKSAHISAITVKKLTSSVDLLISTRYHGTFFALSQNIPSISLVMDKYYQLKFSQILRIFYKEEAGNYLCGINGNLSSKEIFKKVNKILANLSFEKEKLKRINFKLKKRRDLFWLDELCKI